MEKTREGVAVIGEKTGDSLGSVREAVARVEERADSAILSAVGDGDERVDRRLMGAAGLRRSRSGGSERAESPSDSGDITDQPDAYSPPQMADGAAEAASRSDDEGARRDESTLERLSRVGRETTNAAGRVGSSGLSALKKLEEATTQATAQSFGGRVDEPEGEPAGPQRSWSSLKADADAPVGGRAKRTEVDIEPAEPEPEPEPPRGSGMSALRSALRRGDDTGRAREEEEADDEDDVESGERKGLLTGMASSVVGSATEKAKKAGQKVGLVDKPPETYAPNLHCNESRAHSHFELRSLEAHCGLGLGAG